ncbi:hypothetical protein J5N97_002427 [Dioscorea zingiberensis]|uniref:Uncharacterized protein n=1 Tax=Dioscorea zingiberensis TaxID=325984 RepID=A0A9D5D2P7_9LILI|nr:hypothetical protein J5N97_002427 [Dioscorea zingiberensis]
MCSYVVYLVNTLILFPEACAAILWKTSKAAPKEPLGGAHINPAWISQQIKIAVMGAMNELLEMDTPTLLNHRMLKFRQLGGFIESENVDPAKKVNMKKKDEPIAELEEQASVPDLDLELEVEKLKQQIETSKEDASFQPPDLSLNEMIEKLKKEVDREFAEAARSMGLQEKLEMLKK